MIYLVPAESVSSGRLASPDGTVSWAEKLSSPRGDRELGVFPATAPEANLLSASVLQSFTFSRFLSLAPSIPAGAQAMRVFLRGVWSVEGSKLAVGS